MRHFSWSCWDTLCPSTAFFGQSLAAVITYHDNRGDWRGEGGSVTYLPVFFGWR